MKTWSLLTLLSAVCLILSTGCASNLAPTVSTWRNPGFSPSRTSPITFKTNVNAFSEDVAAGHILADELQQEGFKLVSEDQSDYLLSFVISQNLEEHTYTVYHTVQNSTQPTRETGGIVTTPTYSYDTQQNSYAFPTRDIRLFLYTNPKTNPAGLQLAWQGTLTLYKKTTPETQQELFKTLLQSFGADKK